MCSNDGSSILNSLPFRIYKKEYPILHILAGEHAEVFVHIFEKNHFVFVFQDNLQELNDYHRDVIEHYGATFIHSHYQFILDNAKESYSLEDGSCFDLMQFFDILNVPEEVLKDGEKNDIVGDDKK